MKKEKQCDFLVKIIVLSFREVKNGHAGIMAPGGLVQCQYAKVSWCDLILILTLKCVHKNLLNFHMKNVVFRRSFVDPGDS